jgi:hypothetical protein
MSKTVGLIQVHENNERRILPVQLERKASNNKRVWRTHRRKDFGQ